MKTANTFKFGVIAATAVVSALVIAATSGCAYQATAPQAEAGVQTVTMTAKRMTTDEKIAYDTANTEVQTVVMVAKRLTAEQKLAMAQSAHRSQPSA